MPEVDNNIVMNQPIEDGLTDEQKKKKKEEEDASIATKVKEDQKAQAAVGNELMQQNATYLINNDEDISFANDMFVNMFLVDNKGLSLHKDDTDNEFLHEFRGTSLNLNSKQDYIDSGLLKKKYGDNIEAFEKDYDLALHYKNVIESGEVSEVFNTLSNAPETSMEQAFIGYGSKFRGEETDDSIDLQKASTLYYQKDEFGNLESLDDEAKEFYNHKFRREQGAISRDPYERGTLYVEPVHHGDENIGYDILSRYDLDQSSTFNMAKKELDAIEYLKFIPKTFNNSIIGVMNGVGDALQSSIFNDPDSSAYRSIQDMKNTLDTYKIGSSTTAQLEPVMQNFESLVDNSLNVFGQVAVASSVAFLTRSLGPSISALSARMVYTATVLDGTRKEALDNGLSHDAADVYTMASALGFYTASKLSEYAFSSLSLRAINNDIKALIKADSIGFIKAAAAEAEKGAKLGITKTALKYGTNFGRKAAKVYNKAVNSNIMVEGFIHEAAEEGTEEIFQEAARQITNFYTATNNNAYPDFDAHKGRFATFGDDDYVSNVMSNVGTSMVLGGLGGAVMGGAKSIMTWKLKDVPQDKLKDYADIVRRGKDKEFVNVLNQQYDKGLLGSKNLSFKQNSKGEFEVADNAEDSQAMFNYQLILNNLSTVKDALGVDGVLFKDPDFEESNFTLSKRSQEVVDDLIDLYRENDLTYDDVEAINNGDLAEYNRKHKTKINQDIIDSANDLNKKIRDIKSGKEHIHFFIKDKIREDSIFGDIENRDEIHKDKGEYFYESVLESLSDVRGKSTEAIDRLAKMAKVNNAEVDEFIEMHKDNPIKSVDSFIENGMVLLSKESVAKIIRHNEKFYNVGAGSLLGKYESNSPYDVKEFLLNNHLSFDSDNLKASDMLSVVKRRVAELNDHIAKKTEIDEKVRYTLLEELRILEDFNVTDFVFLRSVNPDLHNELTLISEIDYDALLKDSFDVVINSLFDDNKELLAQIEKGGEVPSDAYLRLEFVTGSNFFFLAEENIKRALSEHNDGEVPVAIHSMLESFNSLDTDIKEKIYTDEFFEADGVFNGENLNIDELKKVLNPEVYEANAKLASLRTAEDVSSAAMGDKSYLSSSISGKGFTGTHFAEPVSKIISEFNNSGQDGLFTWNDTDALDAVMDDVVTTNRFFQVSASNLELLGKIQRKISNNTQGGKLTYEKYKKGEDPGLGVINDLIGPSLYDVERVDYLDRMGQTNTDEYRSAMSIKKAIHYDEKNVKKAIEEIENPYNYINTKLENGEALTSFEEKWIADYYTAVEIIETDPNLTDELKTGEIEIRKRSAIEDKLNILEQINHSEDYSITEKHRVTIAVLNTLKEYIKSQKDNLHLVSYGTELKKTLKRRFKSLNNIINSVEIEACK